jgi:hypothetical protein
VLYSENNLLNTGVKMGVGSQQKKKERKKERKKDPTHLHPSFIQSKLNVGGWMKKKKKPKKKEE